MAKVTITENILENIATAIRTKAGTEDLMRPSEMPAAINAIESGGYPEPTGTINITQNGTENVKDYAAANVNVPNSYSASDEGKVVDGGALVTQGSQTITQNGTYDTTLIAELVANISGGGEEDWKSLNTYIESSGTQYINTGYYVQDNSLFELIAEFPQSNATYATAFGVRAYGGDSPSNASCLLFARYSNNNRIVANFGSNAITLVNDSSFYETKARYKLKKNNVSGETMDSILGAYTNSTASATSVHQMEIFGLNQGGADYGSATRCSMKLYRFRIYESDTLVHEFIPWQDNNDVICLKDTVTGNLKYNAGTGVFTYGSDE